MYFRLFEYLAAAQDQAPTAIPGDESFTSALIHALEHLLKNKKEGRFTTDELLRTIKVDAPNFPKNQNPILSERGDMHAVAGRIMLHPLRQDRVTSPHHNERIGIDHTKKHTVTLHFDFGVKPSQRDLETLGGSLNSIFERNTLDVHRVRWGGMTASMFARAAKRFRALKRRASERKERVPIEARAGLQTPDLASSPSWRLLTPPATGYHSQESAGTPSGGGATSHAGSADSSEELRSVPRISRKRRKFSDNGNSESCG